MAEPLLHAATAEVRLAGVTERPVGMRQAALVVKEVPVQLLLPSEAQ